MVIFARAEAYVLAVVGEVMALPEPTRLRKLIDGQQLAFIIPVPVRNRRDVTRNAKLPVDAVERAHGRFGNVVDLESRCVENASLVLDEAAELTVVVSIGNAMLRHYRRAHQLRCCDCEENRAEKRARFHRF